MTHRRKAIALLSGGLDSRLAVRIIQEQGVDVIAMNFVTPFCNCTSKGSCKMEAKKASEEFGVPLKVIALFDEYLAVIKNPRYGYGSGINPCLDCRILMFKKAKEYMGEIGASFIITGEVLGERPMSQRLDAIRIIERDSGLAGLIVRPLSAKLFEPSIPEKEGWVDRDRLLAISGRSRRPQIKLARELEINDYPCPAGGCLLTDKAFAGRLRGLFEQNPDPSKNDIMLLKVGRHFSGPSGSRIVVGRNELENARLEELKSPGDWLVVARDWQGPTTIVRSGRVTGEDLDVAAEITAGYGKGRHESKVVIECRLTGGDQIIKTVTPAPQALAIRV